MDVEEEEVEKVLKEEVEVDVEAEEDEKDV